jgi:formate dehydrogenase major subunit
VVEPPGEARLDWQIICEIATRMGYPMQYPHTGVIFDEMVGLTHAYRGLSHAALGADGKVYPCPDPEHSDGTEVMFGDGFPTADGRARFVPAVHHGADELPDAEHPFVLVTGRVLEHWHTGVMTRRSKALSAIEPEAFADLHEEDAGRLGLCEGDWVRISSRRGEISLQVRVGRSVQPGSVFVPFHYREAGANLLTNPKLDPDGKIPEFKFAAVKIEPTSAPV